MSALDDILARLHFEDNRVIERCVARSCVIDNDDAEAAAQELFDLRTRIAELEALTQWQPIETAPIKPEGDYLGFQCGEVFKMYWNYFRDGWVDCYSEVFSEPSHWMSLPKPPEEK